MDVKRAYQFILTLYLRWNGMVGFYKGCDRRSKQMDYWLRALRNKDQNCDKNLLGL
jgi:hypothetical protein